MPVLGRIAVLLAVAACLAGCAGTEAVYAPHLAAPSSSQSEPPLQCVPYAREHSTVKLYGDAWTWWKEAAGKFPRHSTPKVGAVIVLAGYAGIKSGHVAVVRALIGPREIRVDHANWLDDGRITLGDPVADVSAGNDWTLVRVWNVETGAWGGRVYPVEGFIGPADEIGQDRIAEVDLSHQFDWFQ